MDRTYTYHEINQMREIIRFSYPTGVSYYPSERDADIERRLTTYISASVDPEDMRQEQLQRQQALVELNAKRKAMAVAATTPKSTRNLEELRRDLAVFKSTRTVGI